MRDLEHFALSDMMEFSAGLRVLGAGCGSMEEVAERVVRYVRDGLGGVDGERACPLVRFYKTHDYGLLDPELQAFARRTMGNEELEPSVKCLTLLATAGEERAWNDRRLSVGHRAIALPSPEIVGRIPMVAQLVHQFGLDPDDLIDPTPELVGDLEQATFNVFHVESALGSRHIPAQDDFVVPYRIASVLGFGGMLPSGDLFAVILFSRVPISAAVADVLRPLALATKAAVLPLLGAPLFRDDV